MSRWRSVLPIAAAAAAALLAAALIAPAPSAHADLDPGCIRQFPRLILGSDDGLVVCSDTAGTATLVVNATAAVWVVGTPGPAAIPVVPLDPAARSFLDLVRTPGSYIPSTAAAVVPSPADRLELTVEPRLTLAQLAHDQLVTTLARKGGPAPAALRTSPSSARRALSACLFATLEHLDSPEWALTEGSPAEVLAEAAHAVDSGGRSACGAAWIEAKLNANLPSGDVTPFVSDIVAWEANASFAARSAAASAAYRALLGEDAE